MSVRETLRDVRVLVVDDEEGARDSLELILEDHYETECAEDGLQALEMIQQRTYDLVLLDINMPELNGIEILKRIRNHSESIDVIMVSAADRAHEATASMKCGACDYITKPYEPEEILAAIERVLEKRSSREEIPYESLGSSFRFNSTEIVSQSSGMHVVFRMIEKVACTSSNILITGESGTGKELIARAIHARSHRANKPFVAINCAAVPPELIESDLFGHEKGAFTGAHARNIGKFEFAHGGSIFLDEISSLKLEFQAKLLRVLQEREFSRIGSHQTIKVDVRIIAATNNRLERMVAKKQFRGDLYFRLNVIPITLPPLRERKGDIPLLAEFFLVRFNRLLDKKVKGISADAMDVLEAYPWPGNVRELENVIERLVVLGTDGQAIQECDLPFNEMIHEEAEGFSVEGHEDWELGLLRARDSFERQYVLRALERCRWNLADTAKLLRIHRNTLTQKLKVLGLKAKGNVQESNLH